MALRRSSVLEQGRGARMSGYGGKTDMSGGVALTVERALPMRPLSLREMLHEALPRPGLTPDVFKWRCSNLPFYLRSLPKVAICKLIGAPVLYGSLYLTVLRADGERIPLGLVGHKVVTTAGVTKIVDFLRANDVTTAQNFKYHSIGTGSGAEAIGDVALGTELTTEYTPDSTR